jgi:hypothetical protein
MADGRRNGHNQTPQAVSPEADEILRNLPERLNQPAYPETTRGHTWTPVQEAAAKLYAAGFRRNQISKALVDYLCPRRKKESGETLLLVDRLKRSRKKLRDWESEEWFRNRLFELVTIGVDMEIPGIMKGVVHQAKKGRVDAAKFSLEIANRYSPKESASGGNVTVQFGNLPRPRRHLGEVVPEIVEDED